MASASSSLPSWVCVREGGRLDGWAGGWAGGWMAAQARGVYARQPPSPAPAPPPSTHVEVRQGGEDVLGGGVHLQPLAVHLHAIQRERLPGGGGAAAAGALAASTLTRPALPPTRPPAAPAGSCLHSHPTCSHIQLPPFTPTHPPNQPTTHTPAAPAGSCLYAPPAAPAPAATAGGRGLLPVPRGTVDARASGCAAEPPPWRARGWVWGGWGGVRRGVVCVCAQRGGSPHHTRTQPQPRMHACDNHTGGMHARRSPTPPPGVRGEQGRVGCARLAPRLKQAPRLAIVPL